MSMISYTQSKNLFREAGLAVVSFLLLRRSVISFVSSLVPVVIVSGVIAPSMTEAAAGRIVTGIDSGPGGPIVKAFTTRTRTNVANFFAYTPSFAGGVRVAVGDATYELAVEDGRGTCTRTAKSADLTCSAQTFATLYAGCARACIACRRRATAESHRPVRSNMRRSETGRPRTRTSTVSPPRVRRSRSAR